MKKIICLLFGHKAIVSECPVTGIKLSQCSRCESNKHPRTFSFN